MKVDIEDVLFWMDAIRNSNDRYRTLESFWKGQVISKVWLIENLSKYVLDKPNRIVIHGGWNGVLASLLFNSNIPIEHITSVDIDPACEEISYTVNKRYEMQGRFSAVTADMQDFEYTETPNIVINTSAEHIDNLTLKKWQKQIPYGSLVVVQSNDFFELEEHINCVNSSAELEDKLNLNKTVSSFLPTEKYYRYMVIGYKDV
jgi:hypothetical protein